MAVSLSHVAARQEMRAILTALGLEAYAAGRPAVSTVAAEEADAVQLALVEHQLAETHVVDRGGSEAAAAGRDRAVAEVGAGGRVVHEGEGAVGAARVVGGEAGGVADAEAGVAHAERLEDALVEERGEGLAGDDLHQAAEHVGGDGVVPLIAGLGQEGKGGEAGDHLGERAVVGLEIDGAGAVQRVHQGGLHEAVGQAGGVGEEVTPGDGAPGGFQLQLQRVAADGHGHVRELGEEVADRVVELEQALLVEHHDGQARERLGHGVDADNGVRRHGRAGGEVGQPGGALVGDPAAAGQGDGQASELPIGDEAVHPGVHAGKLAGGQADILRAGAQQRVHDLVLRSWPRLPGFAGVASPGSCPQGRNGHEPPCHGGASGRLPTIAGSRWATA